MHICLLPIEILLHIFAIINNRGCYQDRLDSLATIAALARTCRTFKEPALDTLWKDMQGFKPLILCLPEAIRERTPHGRLTLKRPLFAGEWKIFNQYASRIRSLTIYHTHLTEVDAWVLKSLVCAPSPALLPNLHNLQWWDDKDCFLPLLHALLVPTIRSMALEPFAVFDPWVPSFTKSAFLVSLGARCPHIQEFVCPYSSDSDDHSDALCDAVCCWSELSHLRTRVLNTRALAHLASLSSLRSLHFMSRGFVDSTPPNSIPTFASKLDEVSIAARSLLVLTQCLRNVCFTSCHSVVLRVDSILPYDPLDIPNLISALSVCFSPDLEQLIVDFTGIDSNSLSTEKLADLRFALSFNAVVPLLSFSCLKHINLSYFCASGINDAMIKDMAQSWPQLEEFYIGSTARWLIPPALTFTGLVHLIRHCQYLQDVAIPFRASLIDIKSEPFSKTIPNTKITGIYVGNSPIDVAITTAVAYQLHTLLPNLRNVHCFPLTLRISHPPPPLERSDVEWGRVEEFLVELTGGAEISE